MNGCAPAVRIPGPAGASAFTFVSANFIIPAIAANVQISVLDTSWMVPGENVIIAGPANFQILTVDSPTQFTGTFLGLNGDLPAATVISLPAQVSPVGAPGANGVNGYSVTTSNFTVPSIGSTVSVPVNNSSDFVVGQYVISTGPANFIVTAIGTTTSLTLKFLGNPNDVAPGTVIALGSTITSAGQVGGNAWTTNTTQFTIPNVGSNVTVNLADARWMEVGQNVVFGGPATFKVVSTNVTVTPNTAVLTFLGYIGDLAPTGVISSGTGVSPSGTQTLTPSVVIGLGTGTAYTLTTSLALLSLGTTQPSVTLPAKGTFLIFASAQIAYNNQSAVFVLNTLLQRTNNTPGAVANSTSTIKMATITGGSGSGAGADQNIVLPLGVYTTTTVGDILQIWGSYTNLAGTPAPTCTSASLYAVQIA
jgi:hypothetical protein